MKTNTRNEYFPAFEARDAISTLAQAMSSKQFAVHLWERGLRGKCKTIESLAAKMRAYRDLETMERPYFSEVDVMMDVSGEYAPLQYLCERHGFNAVPIANPFDELDEIERKLDEARYHAIELEQKREALLKLTRKLDRPKVVNGGSYSR